MEAIKNLPPNVRTQIDAVAARLRQATKHIQSGPAQGVSNSTPSDAPARGITPMNTPNTPQRPRGMSR